MNRFDRAKEEIYNALWELCEEDEETYQNACSGLGAETIMEEVAALAAKLDDLSQKYERKKENMKTVFYINGKKVSRKAAEEAFWVCDWQHPSTVMNELVQELEEG